MVVCVIYYPKLNNVLFWKMMGFSLLHRFMAQNWLLYLENTPVFQVVFFCCIYPKHLQGRPLKILSAIKLVRGAKKVGDCWFRGKPYLTGEEETVFLDLFIYFGMNLLNKTSPWLKYQCSENTIEMSAPWVFYHCVNQYNNRPPMGGTMWEESSLTEGVEDKKGTSGRCGTCLPPLWCGCCCPGRWGCRSQVRMRSPFGFLTPEALLFAFLFFFPEKKKFPKIKVFLCWIFFSVSFFFFSSICVKRREKPSSALRLRRCMKVTALRVRGLGSLCGKVLKRERMANVWREHFARRNKGDARQVVIMGWEVAITS